ncbi:MAG: ANR family transcriptional regulator [Sodalis sp. (in: enterobacteria)]
MNNMKCFKAALLAKALESDREFAEAIVQWGKAAKQAKSPHNMGWALMRKDYCKFISAERMEVNANSLNCKYLLSSLSHYIQSLPMIHN